jgi:protein-tyrosine phosphatase
MTAPCLTDRWLDLPGTENVRDLGGLPTTDGRHTRFGMVLRADTVQELAPDAARWLRTDYGLRTVVDLRTQLEAQREGRGPLAAEPVTYHNLPFLPDQAIIPGADRGDVIVADRYERDRVGHYLDYLRRAPEAVVSAVEAVAAGSPALFHCAAGKDRTGVLAAVLLEAVGVEREAVVADYALTNDRLDRIAAKLARLPTYAPSMPRRDRASMACEPHTMAAFLEALDDRYGGARRWLQSVGLPAATLQSLRECLVGDGPAA